MDVIKRFATERSDSLPVADGQGGPLGVVTVRDVEQRLSLEGEGEGEGEGGGDGDPTETVTALALLREAPRLRVGDTLETAVIALGETDDDGLPVLAEADDVVVGWLTHRDLLRAYRNGVLPPEPDAARGPPRRRAGSGSRRGGGRGSRSNGTGPQPLRRAARVLIPAEAPIACVSSKFGI